MQSAETIRFEDGDADVELRNKFLDMIIGSYPERKRSDKKKSKEAKKDTSSDMKPEVDEGFALLADKLLIRFSPESLVEAASKIETSAQKSMPKVSVCAAFSEDGRDLLQK